MALNPMHGTADVTPVEIDMGASYRYVEVLYRSGTDDLWIMANPADEDTLVGRDGADVIPGGVTGGSTIIDSPSSANTIVRLEAGGAVDFTLKGLDG
jgi:hypothetical protein